MMFRAKCVEITAPENIMAFMHVTDVQDFSKDPFAVIDNMYANLNLMVCVWLIKLIETNAVHAVSKNVLRLE